LDRLHSMIFYIGCDSKPQFRVSKIGWPIWMVFSFAFIVGQVVCQAVFSQELSPLPAKIDPSSPQLPLSDFRPIPRLRVKETLLTKASNPVVDVHSHFSIRLRHDPNALEEYLQVMDRNSVAVSISLDGTLGPKLEEHINYLWTKHRDRFVIFANIDWENHGRVKPDSNSERVLPLACLDPGFAVIVVEQLRLAKAKGVSGLKIFKQLGLQYKDHDGRFLSIDDHRWDPIWSACGKLGMPVILHTADPSAFFEPVDANNERYEELARHPEWSFYGNGVPSRSKLHEQRNRIIERHPETTFIAAHFGNDAEDLEETARWLERYPNLYIEFASRISELGRQPFTSKRFFERFQDRILFGTDGPWPELRLQSYWRFLETDDEYFPYSEKVVPPQGLWQIYGLDLSDEILQKIYHGNASKIIPGVRDRVERFSARSIVK
jgi:predicted TIM-barrel fold metal-dependent hydrolase